MIDLSRYSSQGFDRGASRLKEAAWWVVKLTFFLPAWPWPSSLRCWWLRRFGAMVGRGVVIRSRVNISFPWRFRCGDHVWIGEEVAILSLAPVTLGSHVCLSQRSFLCSGSHDFSRETFDLVTAPITLGSGCWVGAQAFVGPGVVFGDASRCGAGAVVIRDVPAATAVFGVPAAAREKRGA